jgi:hypothetical protein
VPLAPGVLDEGVGLERAGSRAPAAGLRRFRQLSTTTCLERIYMSGTSNPAVAAEAAAGRVAQLLDAGGSSASLTLPRSAQ